MDENPLINMKKKYIYSYVHYHHKKDEYNQTYNEILLHELAVVSHYYLRTPVLQS